MYYKRTAVVGEVVKDMTNIFMGGISRDVDEEVGEFMRKNNGGRRRAEDRN
jgi:hypothetical protein